MKESGIAVLKWGTENETWGFCEDLSISDEADKTQIKNGDDDTVGLIYSDIRQKVTGNYTPLAGQSSPPFTKADIIGSSLTVKTDDTGTISIIVDNAEKKYQKGNIATWSVTGYNYPNIST